MLALSSPVLVPGLLLRRHRFRRNRTESFNLNRQRIDSAEPVELPELRHLELTVLVDHKTRDGFLGAAGVSYWIKTDRGSVLFDVGYGPDSPTLVHNAERLGFTLGQVDAVVVSHLHPDHMGGLAAARTREIRVPVELGPPEAKPCFLPAECAAPGFEPEVVDRPRLLPAGLASTGPLTRSLFLMGMVEEQALVARLKDKGLVVLTGCGHPSIETIVEMVERTFGGPIYAIVGGLHFPVTASSLRKAGVELQMILGTGKAPWQRLTDDDLTRTIANMAAMHPKRLLLSGHDTCDHALARFTRELECEADVLAAGGTWVL